MTYPGIANIYANSERGGLILMYKRVMIKISGEALAGETGFGLDFDTIGDIAKTKARKLQWLSAAEISGADAAEKIWTEQEPIIWECSQRL